MCKTIFNLIVLLLNIFKGMANKLNLKSNNVKSDFFFIKQTFENAHD